MIFKLLFLKTFFPRARFTEEWVMLSLVNKERRKKKLSPLLMQEDLRQVARKHSADMAQKHYFDHTNKDNLSPHERIEEAHISDAHTGENLAFVRGYPFPTARAMEGLMQSPGHKANILHPSYTTVGIGLSIAEDGAYYYTQNFATRYFRFCRLPRRTRRGKTLLLKGRYLGDPIPAFLLFTCGDVERKFPLPLDPTFRLPLVATPHGKATLQIYVQQQQDTRGNYILTNTFTVKITKGWLW